MKTMIKYAKEQTVMIQAKDGKFYKGNGILMMPSDNAGGTVTIGCNDIAFTVDFNELHSVIINDFVDAFLDDQGAEKQAKNPEKYS